MRWRGSVRTEHVDIVEGTVEVAAIRGSEA